jgi:hypothetical protein
VAPILLFLYICRAKHLQAVNFNVFLTTYEFAMRDRRFLKKISWEYIIVDEVCTRMKHVSVELLYTRDFLVTITAGYHANAVFSIYLTLNALHFCFPTRDFRRYPHPHPICRRTV